MNTDSRFRWREFHSDFIFKGRGQLQTDFVVKLREIAVGICGNANCQALAFKLVPDFDVFIGVEPAETLSENDHPWSGSRVENVPPSEFDVGLDENLLYLRRDPQTPRHVNIIRPTGEKGCCNGCGSQHEANAVNP